ncbi:MAG: NAD-dependent epimerase/dehydratase family protein [Vulcanimicrobiaceae bacterium]
MRVLIIGGAGFIGSNAASYYAQRDNDLCILDNFSRPGARINAGWLQSCYPRICIEHADIRFESDVLRDEVKRADLILHEAAQVAVTTSVTNPREDFCTNAMGTFNVLEALRAGDHGQILVYASTNKVYGDLAHREVANHGDRYMFADAPTGIPESELLDFHSPYGCSKGAAEQYVRDYARIYGLRTLAFRQSCIYGPRQYGVEDQGWIAWFAIRASQGLPVTIFGDGMQVRDVLYVEDLIEAYDLAVTHIATTAGKIYNLGGGPSNTLSIRELVALLETRYNRRMEVTYADWRPGDQRVFVSSVKKAKDSFGWSPRTGVGEGLSAMCDWIDVAPKGLGAGVA